jgi:hypothetical protein
VAIDRTDHTTRFSQTRDDGLSWCGVQCASMLLAWVSASAAVSTAIHHQAAPGSPPTSAPVVLMNYAGSTRIELLEHADGIFSEEGDAVLNSIGLSALAMPAIGTLYSTLPHTTLPHTRLDVPEHGQQDHQRRVLAAAPTDGRAAYGPRVRR